MWALAIVATNMLCGLRAPNQSCKVVSVRFIHFNALTAFI
jgi:hypothetical protein